MDIPNLVHPFILIILIQTMASLEEFGENLWQHPERSIRGYAL